MGINLNMTKENIRKKYNLDFINLLESDFTDYEKHLENVIIELQKKEFHRFLNLQVEEMKKYKWISSEKAGMDLGCECYEKWIQENAAKFRKMWEEN